MLLEPLVSTIETVKARIANHGQTLRQNETRTRAALIDPLLAALGWDTSDPALVTPEYRVEVGWADYALAGVGNQSIAVIEAKRLGSIVENHLEQAVGYCIQQGIAYAGVTDGNHWQLYRTFEPVPLTQKLVLDVSIANTPPHESALKLLLLWRPNLAPGQPVVANEPVFSKTSEAPIETLPIIESPAVPLSMGEFSDTSMSTCWTPLSQIHLVKGKGRNPSPQGIRFSGGQARTIEKWVQMYIEVAEWLVSNGKMTAQHLPIRGLGFVNRTPTGPQGKPYGWPHQVSGGIYLNAKSDATTLVANSKKLLNYFGVDAETIELRLG